MARLSTELKFKAVANACVELQWLVSLLNDLGFHLSCPPHIWCDNSGAVFLSSNPAF